MHNKNKEPFSVLMQLEMGIDLQDCGWAD